MPFEDLTDDQLWEKLENDSGPDEAQVKRWSETAQEVLQELQNQSAGLQIKDESIILEIVRRKFNAGFDGASVIVSVSQPTGTGQQFATGSIGKQPHTYTMTVIYLDGEILVFLTKNTWRG